MRGERLLTLVEARRWMADTLGIRRSQPAVWSWITVGVGGVRLEAASVGGKWFTSEAAIRRFITNGTRRHAAEYGANVAELKV